MGIFGRWEGWASFGSPPEVSGDYRLWVQVVAALDADDELDVGIAGGRLQCARRLLQAAQLIEPYVPTWIVADVNRYVVRLAQEVRTER